MKNLKQTDDKRGPVKKNHLQYTPLCRKRNKLPSGTKHIVVIAFPNYLFHNEMAIRFLSCSNPYPVEMDPGCFPPVRSLVSEYAPFVLYDFCLICLPAVSNDSCFTYIYSYVPKFGVPCYSGSPKIKNTFCAGGGACVPLYKDYPETYTGNSIKPPATTQSGYPLKSGIPFDDKKKVVVMKKKRAQTLSSEHYKTSVPKENGSNMPALKTPTSVPACEYCASNSIADYGFQAWLLWVPGRDGQQLIDQANPRVRLEHERVMKEERGQNCCLCGLLLLSIFMAAALLTVAFYDRMMSQASTNLTRSQEIDSPIYFGDFEFNQQ
uniref:Uncharacterized protein n=1 Tax=Romanomermis culicivorax TaxID=13658 RepID=A0A915IW12_ROMCU